MINILELLLKYILLTFVCLLIEVGIPMIICLVILYLSVIIKIMLLKIKEKKGKKKK